MFSIHMRCYGDMGVPAQLWDLTLPVLGVFTPQKWTNTTNQGFLTSTPREATIKHVPALSSSCRGCFHSRVPAVGNCKLEILFCITYLGESNICHCFAPLIVVSYKTTLHVFFKEEEQYTLEMRKSSIGEVEKFS